MIRIIKIAPLENGAHNNQTYHGVIPEGWAIIPDELETPNFPFGEAEAEEIDGVMTVTKWVAGTVPEVDPIPEPEPTVTAEDMLNALVGGMSYE